MNICRCESMWTNAAVGRRPWTMADYLFLVKRRGAKRLRRRRRPLLVSLLPSLIDALLINRFLVQNPRNSVKRRGSWHHRPSSVHVLYHIPSRAWVASQDWVRIGEILEYIGPGYGLLLPYRGNYNTSCYHIHTIFSLSLYWDFLTSVVLGGIFSPPKTRAHTATIPVPPTI